MYMCLVLAFAYLCGRSIAPGYIGSTAQDIRARFAIFYSYFPYIWSELAVVCIMWFTPGSKVTGR